MAAGIMANRPTPIRAVSVLAVALALALATPVCAQEFTESRGGVLRWLDKLTGETGNIELARGQAVQNGRLTIQLDGCRYPTDNPASDAEAHLTILDTERKDVVFAGWMLASSPALSAMDHPRYDVWVLRCLVPEGALPEVDTSPAEGE